MMPQDGADKLLPQPSPDERGEANKHASAQDNRDGGVRPRPRDGVMMNCLRGITMTRRR